MHEPEKQQVIQAIGDLGRRVTVADVSAKTGLPLQIVTPRLNEVAADTSGNLQVANTGDILYCFRPGFEATYVATGLRRAFGQVSQWMFDLAYYLLKISFGIVLIASLITVTVLIVIVIIAALFKSSDSGGGGGDSGGGDFNLDWTGDLFNFFAWNYTPTYSNYDYWGGDSSGSRPVPYGSVPVEYLQSQTKSSFLMNCYSYLFGEGNPNIKFDEHKWQVVAEFIRHNQGVVTAEQLAPYTGANPGKEDEVLPVLVRFDGRPEVTENGNIVYIFPSLQVSGRREISVHSAFPAYVEEQFWTFTGLSGGEFFMVFIFALLNFCGSFWLWTHMNTVATLHPFTFLIGCGSFRTTVRLRPAVATVGTGIGDCA